MICPVYHGRVGDGFCPLFVDAQTAAEAASQYHDWWLREARENDDLRQKLQSIKGRGLAARIFQWSRA